MIDVSFGAGSANTKNSIFFWAFKSIFPSLLQIVEIWSHFTKKTTAACWKKWPSAAPF